jgi:hypothetical protein
MANKKFSEFTLKTDSANVDFVVGYDGSDNVRIAPSNLSSGGASDLNGLSDCLIDGTSSYLVEVPSGLSGNPVDNTVIGNDAGSALTTGFGNTFIGFEAGKLITDSDNMVVIGRQAANASASNGDRTVAIGYDAYGSSISTDNVAVGYAASQFSGVNFCVAIGSSAALFNSGANAISIGYQTNYNNSTSGTVSVGYQAGRSQTSGASNTNVGYKAGYQNTTSANRTYMGYEAGNYNSGANNTGIGYRACNGYYSFGTGQGTGADNTGLGYEAMSSLNGASAIKNTAVGVQCLGGVLTAGNNAALGYRSGFNVTSGANNTFIGSQAGDAVTTGSNNTVIGYDASASAVDATNEITLGNSSIATLRCQVQTISSLSDKRDKTNIEDSDYGLDLVNSLKPVTFDWNMRDGAKVGQKDLGFIAQDLQELDDENLQLVYSNNPEKLEASYGRLIPVLVKAIQDLSAKVTALENK